MKISEEILMKIHVFIYGRQLKKLSE